MLLATAQRLARTVLNARGVRSKFVPTRHARVHHFDGRGTGKLPPIALLHGLGGAASSYARLMLALRPHTRRVLAFDLPAHGWSERPDGGLDVRGLEAAVSEALDATLDEPTILLGNSLGGAVAVRYALTRPARLAGLVLTSPAGARIDAADVEELRRTFAVASAADVRRLTARLFQAPPWYVALVVGELRRKLAGPEIQGFLASLTVDDTLDCGELAGLTIPTLLLWGRCDRLLPRSHLAFWRRCLPAHATVDEPQGFGHSPHFDSVSELAARVRTFAGTVQPAA